MSFNNLIPLMAAAGGDYQIERSVRLRSSASAYLNRTPAVAGNRKTWTWSGWVKRGSLGGSTNQLLFSCGNGTADTTWNTLCFQTTDALLFTGYNTVWRMSSAVFRDPSAWYHIVLAFDSTQATGANRVKLFVNGVQLTSFSTSNDPTLNTDYAINQAYAHIISGNLTASYSYFDGYLTEVNFIDGQALTASSFGETDSITGVWKAKKYTGTYGNNGFFLPFKNNTTQTSGNLVLYSQDYTNAMYNKERATITANTTTAPNGSTTASKLTEDTTASNTHRWYFNNLTFTNGSAYTYSIYVKAAGRSAVALEIWNGTTAKYCYADLSTGTVITGSDATAIVTSVGNGWYRCSVTLSGVGNAGCGGSVYMMSSATAGATSYTGDGASGVYLWGTQMEVNSSVGPYYSTNGTAISSTLQIGTDTGTGYNNWVVNNISLTNGNTYDSMLDTPTPYADGGNGRGNYPVINPLNGKLGTSQSGATANISVSNGNLTTTAQGSEGVNNSTVLSTMTVPNSGKWYWEWTTVTVPTAAASRGGFGIMDTVSAHGPSGGDGHYSTTGKVYGYLANGNKVLGGLGTSAVFTAYGATYGNGVVIGVALDMDSGTLTFYKDNTSQGTAFTGIDTTLSFYAYAGYWMSAHVNFGQRPFAYTPPTGFKALNTQNLPEPTIKQGNKYFDATAFTGTNSNQTVTNGGSFQPDLVWIKDRTASGNHQLFNSIVGAGTALASNLTNAEFGSGGVNGFVSNGFTGNVGSTDAYAAWQWKKGATPGFDIVTYTATGSATTFAHSLGVAPAMMIVKKRTGGTARAWAVYHQSLGNTKWLVLNQTDAASVDSGIWNNTSPTSSVFTVGNSIYTNESGGTYVAYCFAEVAGFSKFGSYTGNGLTDGPFVYLGFRPRYVMIKNSSAASQWRLVDTARSPYNLSVNSLRANDLPAENTSGFDIDLTASGFKIRGTGTDSNDSSNVYIYAAFAEHPFKYSLAR
jgi:hypothetical protein